MGTTDLVLLTHFINEATRVQRGCDTLKDRQSFSGVVRSKPSALDCAISTFLYHSVFSSLNRVGILFCHERLDNKYFRFCGPYDPLSYTIHLFKKPHNFHFLQLWYFALKLLIFSRKKMAMGGRLYT